MKIAHTNFWPTFSLHNGLVKHLLDSAFGEWEESISQKDADLVLTSVFPHQPVPFPAKTIAIIWENVRPDYRLYPFSISSDFDDYGGHNVRCPVWYSHVCWSSDMVRPKPSGGGAHNHEPLVPLDELMTPRTGPYEPRQKFCAFVASAFEPFRMTTAGLLNSVAPVDTYGKAFGKEVDPRPKNEILKDYTFSLCFENSLFPGYYTEKLLHAWMAGTVPLYFADGWFAEDFNPMCSLNRWRCRNTEEFIESVKYLRSNQGAIEEMWRQPLLVTKPSLDPVIQFLKRAFALIQSSCQRAEQNEAKRRDFTSFLKETKIGPSRSQQHQDLFVLYELGPKRDGFFVEVGASDGEKFSNTLLLEKDLGWNGIVVEPAEAFHKKLKKNRSCRKDTRCVWSKTGETLQFVETSAPELSTLEQFQDCDDHEREDFSRYLVMTISLNDLLKQHGAPKQIDYISVDTEGSEYEILSTFDFDAYDVKIFTIEHNCTPNREKIYNLMISKGYKRKFESFSLWDDWYVKV